MKDVTCPRCGRLNPPTQTKCKYCLKTLTPASPSATPYTPKKKPPPSPISTTASRSLPSPGKRHTGGTIIIPTPPSGLPAPPSSSSTSPFSKPSITPPTPLPAKFKRLGPPTIEGEVKDTREIQVDKKDIAGAIADGIFNILMLPISPAVAVGSIMAGKNRPKDKVIIYIVRIERPGGMMGQAQIEREFIGGTMEIGDYVSIWGTEHNGVVSLRQAYNHTIRAEIKVR